MASCESLHQTCANLRQPCPQCGEDDFRHLRPGGGGRAGASNGGFRAIPPDPVNHLLHIGLTILTAGLWLPVYGFLLFNSGLQLRSYRRFLQLQR